MFGYLNGEFYRLANFLFACCCVREPLQVYHQHVRHRPDVQLLHRLKMTKKGLSKPSAIITFEEMNSFVLAVYKATKGKCSVARLIDN